MLFFTLLTAILGLAGMTILCPIVARFLWGFKRAGTMTDWLAYNFCNPTLPKNIAVLIPAHNEQSTVESTLKSIWTSVAYAKQQFPDLNVHITIGADGCSDRTSAVAKSENANVFEGKRKGKWKTILSLIRQTPKVDWVVFADCGVQWPQEFLRDLLLHLSDPMLIGLAPRYHNPSAGLLESLAWNIETKLKSLETAAGGPISVHGATVAYRYKELKETLSFIGEQEWINDDIVLPLFLRTKYPDYYIKYATDLYVVESRLSSGVALSFQQHLDRRIRMLKGNIQWIKTLLPGLWKINSVVAVISVRRVFRLFWGYWAIALAIASLAALLQALPESSFLLGFAGLSITIFTLAANSRLKNFAGALAASFIAPLYLFQQEPEKQLNWR